jgi:hypothetical protein
MHRQKFLRILLCSVFLCSFDVLFTGQDYQYLWNLSNQVMVSRALYVAADLELADHLESALSLQELSARISVDQSALQRLLRCLMENGVFAYDQDGLVCNNATSIFLKKDHPQTMRPFILHDDPTRWNAIGNLGHSIKTGKASFNELYQMDYFSSLKNDAVLSERFDEAMTIISQQEDMRIAQMVNFEGIVADIGGGKGQLLQRIAENNEAVTELILFDLQQVQNNIVSQDAVMTQVAGSFFDPITVQADTFILKRILHDWNDAQALRILCNVAAAMTENDVLYIVDAVIDQCQDKKLILDIDLRLLTIFGGQERTKSEFEVLCNAAGLEITAIQELTSISHVISVRKRKGAEVLPF